MWIHRDLSDELVTLTKHFPVIVLTGPRQVGKTSLLEKTFPDYTYVSLDYAQNAEAAETRPIEFLDSYTTPLIIDEIQYAPTLLRHIKSRVDTNKQRGQYLITGSQNFALMKSVSESLAGRAAVISLLGLSMKEWRSCAAYRKTPPDRDFLWRGSYPGLWSEPKSPVGRNRWYQSYVTTYLERDLRNLLNVGSLRDFERFMRACAVRVGQLLNMSEVGRDVGISSTTAREWMSVLTSSNQIFLLEPYHRSLGKRLVKSPKLYFTDTGLASFLSGFESSAALSTSQYYGVFWENHVVSQWLRWRDWFSSAAGLWFWQDRSKHEVDLIIEKNRKLYPIECKATETPRDSDSDGIYRFIDMYGPDQCGQGFVACTTSRAFSLGTGITAVNGWRVWDLGEA